MSLRIVLFGYHRTAVEVASYLRSRDYRITIIDDNEDNLAKARYAGFETARLDFRNDAELKKLNLKNEIDVVFCLFPEDAENVFLIISIKNLAPRMRIFTIAHSREAIPKLIAAGASKVVDTHEITGQRISDVLNRPMVTDILDHTLFGQADLGMAEILIAADSPLLGKRITHLRLDKRYNLILMGVVNPELGSRFLYSMEIMERRLQAGDVLVVIGPQSEITRLREDLQSEESAGPYYTSRD